MFIFASESVSEGHPDKLCDLISDSVLQWCKNKDPKSNVACETFACKNKIIISGEISASLIDEFKANYEIIVKKVLKSINYKNDKYNNNIKIYDYMNSQSNEIKTKVEKEHIGAGDQGLMFGYACNYFNNYFNDYMPIPITLAHKIMNNYSEYRKSINNEFLLPDAKTLVIMKFDNSYHILGIEKIFISCQHLGDFTDINRDKIIRNVIDPIIKEYNIPLINKNSIVINQSGDFKIGGQYADTGLTGRKIIVDTYGGWSRHGGGAFSGKDFTKVDRSGCYYARYIAKNIVAAGLCNECEIQVSYGISEFKECSFYVNTFGSNNYKNINDEDIKEIIHKVFDFSPENLINSFFSKNLDITKSTNYGHFGLSSLDLPWEKLDKVKNIKKIIKETLQ